MSAEGRSVLLAARDGLEAVLLSLVEIPRTFDRDDVRARLMRGIHDVYVALDTSELALAHIEAIHEIGAIASEVGVLARRIATEGEEPAVDRAVARLAAIEGAARAHGERVGSTQLARRDALELGSIAETLPPHRPFRASIGLPRLHAPPRGRLLGHVNVGTNPEPRASAAKLKPTLAELEELVEALAREPEPAPSPTAAPPDAGTLFEPAVEEVEVVRRWARDAIEDIAMHRALRKPNPLESWQDQAKFEQFILDNLDLLAALGAPALPSIILHHAESDAPDAERAFAVALVLGSFEGADTVFSALLTLKQSPPEELTGWAEGFRLASSPMVDAALADLVTAERVDLVVFSLGVLALRGTLDDRLLTQALLRPEVEVRSALAALLGRAGGNILAVPALERMLAETDDVASKLVILESLLARGHEPARLAVRRLAPSCPPTTRRRALELLCIGGGAADLEVIAEELARGTDAAFVRMVGRFGHVATLDALLDLLGSEDDGVPLAAAEALERITAGGLFEEVEEPWDFDLPPEALDVPGAAPVPLRKVRRVVTDETAWRERVAELRPSLDPSLRHRAGRPFTPSVVIDELAALTTPVAQRDQAARELSLALGRLAPFDPHDWVARQVTSLAALRASLREMRAGAWPDGAVPRSTSSSSIGVPFVAPPAHVDAAPMAAAPPSTALPVPTFLLEQAGSARAPAPGIAPAPVSAALPPPVSQSVRDALSSTGPVTALRKDALPFRADRTPPSPGARVEPPTAPAGVLPVAGPSAARGSRVTMVGAPPRSGSALPFDAPRGAAPPAPVDLRETMAVTSSPGPALPFASAQPRLNLLQYATLCAEARHDPRAAEATFAMFGLSDPSARAQEDALWQERLRTSSSERAAWERLVEGLSKEKRGR